MSSRALRRLEKSQAKLEDAEPELENEEPAYTPQSRFNAFALLNGNSEDESDSTAETAPVEETTEASKTPESPVQSSAKASKTSKKKKKKLSRKPAPVDDLDDDDLDQFLSEIRKKDQAQAEKADSVTPVPEETTDEEAPLNEEDPPFAYADSNYVYFTTARLASCLKLLSVGDIRNLDPDTEFKNLFGKLSLETIEDANSSHALPTTPEVAAQIKKLARLTRGWGGKDRKSVPGTTRKLLLTRIRDDWLPTTEKPLGMEELTLSDIIESKEYKEETVDHHTLESKVKNELALGIKYFRFTKVHTMQERVANSRFYAAVVMTPDPDSLFRLLSQTQYHVETLLQAAMVLVRQGNERSASMALIDRALFAFDRSLHKSCHELLQSGKNELVRLPYESFPTRQLYLTIFRVITGLGERSTYLTALNYCKLLLAFAPAEDHLGVRYFMDHYAICAEEYTYLINFVESPLTQTYVQWFTPGLAFSYVLALLQLERESEAEKAIEKAFDAHHFCALRLLQDICLAERTPVGENDLKPSDTVKIETETYMVRAKVLWKRDQDIRFLHDNLMALFTKKASQSNGSWLSKWFGRDKTPTDMNIPINLIRFVILSGENKVMAKIPEKIFSRDDVFEYDIMPPKDETSHYDVFTGAKSSKQTDSLFDHIDHNVISAIVQNQTGAEFETFEDFVPEEAGQADQ